MNKSILKNLKILAVLLSVFILASCGSNTAQQPETGSQTAASVVSNAVTNEMITYETEDYYSEWKSQNPNYIELNGASASVKGSGAAVDGGKITITAAGVYAISGKLDNGQIIVDVQNKGIVKLVLNGMEIRCADSSPIYVKNAGKTIISLQEGTQNTVSDGEKYAVAGTSSDEPNAAIFSKDNLTINGAGTLNVQANFNNGITSKDDLKVTGGNININSKDDGLVGRDMVLVKEGNFKINAGGDGISSTNDTDATKGFIALEGGTFDIAAGTDGIQAKTSMLITNGKYAISTGGGSANGSVKAENDKRSPWGRQESTLTAQSSEEKQSTKGMKASSDITIRGGVFKIDSADDAVHSNNSINIAGGDISIASGDDGLHADSSIAIKDGKINIAKSYEGIESTNIYVSGGETRLVSTDDGFNVSGGNDGSAVNGRPGQNNFSASENSKLDISGGFISVNAGGDGLDSNGSIAITKGTVVVNGPTANNNGALDYNGTFDMSGGFLIAAGSAGMSESPSEQSAQYSVTMYYPTVQKAGTLVHLEDSKGNTVVTFAPEKEYQAVVISSPELKKDASYTLFSGGISTGSASNGLYTGGEYRDGTKVVSFTVSNPVTWLSETGVTTKRSDNPGGPRGGAGGNQGKPGTGRPQG